MSQLKYDVLKCNTCHRTVEREVDQKRPFIDKCVITLGCSGKLVKQGEKSTKSEMLPSPVKDLRNWVPRGTNVEVHTETTINEISLLTGANHLTLAVKRDAPPPALALLNFIVKKSNSVSFVEFNYVRPSGASLILGPDDSAKKLALRFSPTDLVKVYLNGVEIGAGDYVLDATNSSVKFNTLFADEQNYIKVVVFKEDQLVAVQLAFKLNSVLQNSNTDSAWGNIVEISDNDKNIYDIYVCNDLNGIGLDTDLIAVSLSLAGALVTTPAWLMLAVKPWASYDRNLKNHVDFTKLVELSIPIRFKMKPGDVAGLYIDEPAMDDFFPPIRIDPILGKCLPDLDNRQASSEKITIKNNLIM